MELFEMVQGHVYPTTHSLMIQPFKRMWEQDSSREKEVVIKKFTYVELLCSVKKSNPFNSYSEDERPEKVKQEVFGDKEYPLDTDILEATMKYTELQRETAQSVALYEAARATEKKLVDFLKTLDMNERTQSGGLVIKPAEIARIMKEIPDVMQSVQIMFERVNTEISDNARVKGQRIIGDFED